MRLHIPCGNAGDGGDTERTGCCLLVDRKRLEALVPQACSPDFLRTAWQSFWTNGLLFRAALRRALRNSSMLSSDVSAGYDPAYGEAFEKKNAAYLGTWYCS